MLNFQTKNKCMISQKKMNFDLKAVGKKSTRDRTLIKLFKSPAIIASGILKTKFLSSDPDEHCNRLKLLLQEKHTGNNSDINNDEIVAIVDRLLEYKCNLRINMNNVQLNVIYYTNK